MRSVLRAGRYRLIAIIFGVELAISSLLRLILFVIYRDGSPVGGLAAILGYGLLFDALATLTALLPLIAAGNSPGNEIEYPLAVVILGGLVTSTLLNLGYVPALYLLLGRGGVNEEALSEPRSRGFVRRSERKP